MEWVKRVASIVWIAFLAGACIAGAPAVSISTFQPSPSSPTRTASGVGGFVSPYTPPQPAGTAPAPSPSELSPGTPAPGSPTPSGAWMQLVPNSGPPGTQVQIDGYLPGGPTPAEVQNNPALAQATVCWQTCLGGYIEEGQAVKWSASDPGHFQTQFTIPPIPWLGIQGPEPLQTGDYNLFLQCLGTNEAGCATLEGQARAVFHLQDGGDTRCQSNQPCASLAFNPNPALPGDTVQVTGWAPLAGTSAGQPMPYALVLQVPNTDALQLSSVNQAMDGSLQGRFVVPQQIPGQGLLQPGVYPVALEAIRLRPTGSTPIRTGDTPFEVAAPSTWSSLALGRPLWIEPGASLQTPIVAVDPASDQRLADCAPGQINLSQNGGKTWTPVSTAGIAGVLQGTAYALGPIQSPQQPAPACLSVTLDARHPASLYTVFETVKTQIGAPPLFFMGFASSDSGQTWKQIPAPPGLGNENFGGLESNAAGVVQALFSGSRSTLEGPQSTPVRVEQTTDGGSTWSEASLTCPDSGPCLRWGATPASIGGMGASLPQSIRVSTDGGKSWNAAPFAAELREVGPHELVAWNDQTAALLSGGGEFPLRLTRDGGQTWSVIPLPPIPGADSSGPLAPALQALPDGSLLAQAADGKPWALLAPGAKAWCSLSSSGLPPFPTLLRAAAGRLWWQDLQTQKVNSVDLTQVRCGP